MKIIEPSFEIETQIDGSFILRQLEFFARTCYKSEDQVTDDSAIKLLRTIIKRGHESVLEHISITVRVICDRGVSHEIVRHRLGSYSQESTRYCNYGKEGQVTFIRPFFWEENSLEFKCWQYVMGTAECYYLNLLQLGATPQEARSVLPNSLKTEIVITYNLREWRHFFRLRTDKSAHPQMRQITVPMLAKFKELIPLIFDDIGGPECSAKST